MVVKKGGGDHRGAARKVREKILEARGLEKGHYGKLIEKRVEAVRQGIPPDTGEGKTRLMRAIEGLLGADIDDLLHAYEGRSDYLERTAKMMGVDQSTVSKWRLRRGFRDGIVTTGGQVQVLIRPEKLVTTL